ncbi:MAG: 3'-5' exonuclease domain-containing protein 2 [Bacteroidales bacterium]|jgi:ribonuclease D|nr:3'-5' exonuclease domain-containing protein 2 [Bacteroidales bacterium]
MFVSEISKEDLQTLPLVRFSGAIHVVENEKHADISVRQLEKFSVLGFDTETRPSFTKGKINKVALLQLATETDAYLFRLCKMGMSPKLMSLLSNPNILKVGAAIKNDIDVLHRIAKIRPSGFVDLQNMVKDFGIKNTGLAKMAGIILNVRISKSQQLSNWENSILTDAQEKYAATDAWMCYVIYQKLNEQK